MRDLEQACVLGLECDQEAEEKDEEVFDNKHHQSQPLKGAQSPGGLPTENQGANNNSGKLLGQIPAPSRTGQTVLERLVNGDHQNHSSDFEAPIATHSSWDSNLAAVAQVFEVLKLNGITRLMIIGGPIIISFCMNQSQHSLISSSCSTPTSNSITASSQALINSKISNNYISGAGGISSVELMDLIVKEKLS
ncbi:hypothetical protein PPACK8108_LOCUS14007 [Phakopsora pachyrhizi]|uniref:Uncharacterized protein n=1 Tax=Phakopsora pachyrhizi TaxID=170000 RepID=A0AAV0B4E0_PHAPC|nr:hypothetical protein PPACK8108_LOCUS14007 [Phakopsora pachyrhizi]